MATYPHDNPLFQATSASETDERTLSRPPSPRPSQTSTRKPPPAIRRMVLELGFRFRPSAPADVDVHTAKLEVLASDLADVPEVLLSAAIAEWIRTEKFMPKAAELIDLAKARHSVEVKGTDRGLRQLQDHCDALNRSKGQGGWFVNGSPPNRYVDRAA